MARRRKKLNLEIEPEIKISRSQPKPKPAKHQEKKLPFSVGQHVSLQCLRGKAYGIGNAPGTIGSYRPVEGKIVYADRRLITVVNQRGYRESFSYSDFKIGQVKINGR